MMKRLMIMAALASALGFSCNSVKAINVSATKIPATLAVIDSLSTAGPIYLANRGGGSGNDVQPEQRPSYLSDGG